MTPEEYNRLESGLTYAERKVLRLKEKWATNAMDAITGQARLRIVEEWLKGMHSKQEEDLFEYPQSEQ